MFNPLIITIMPFFLTILMFFIMFCLYGGFIKILKKLKMRQVNKIDKNTNYRDIPCFNEIKIAYWLLYNFTDMNKSDLNNGIFSAYLLSWYKKGYIDINVTEKISFLKNNYTIDLKNGTFPKDNSEAKVFSFFRAAAKSNNILEKNEIKEYCSLDENRNELRDTLEFILEDTKNDLEKNNLIKVTPSKDLILFRIPEKYELTEKLLEEYKNLIGLFNFLKDYSNMEDKQHIEVHLWEDYLIFANLFGIADKVKEQFNKISPETSSLNKIFTPSIDDSLAGRIGMLYRLTKLQLISYLVIFGIIFVCFLGSTSFVKTISLLFVTVLLIGSVYFPLKKYITNKKVKEMYSMTEAKITDYIAYEHEEYDSETGKTIRTTTYSFYYEFYVNDILYSGNGYSAGLFKPRKGKKIKIYFNRDNPSKNETKSEHNKYLRTAIFFAVLIIIILLIVKTSLT